MQQKLILPLLIVAVLCGACGKEEQASAGGSAAQSKEKTSEDAAIEKAYGGMTSHSVKRKSE